MLYFSVLTRTVLSLFAMIPDASIAQGLAENYPARPVQVVVPFPPGGVTDVEARLYTQKLTENLGRAFVLDYKAGAGQTIGTGFVAKAAPDGYTLLVITSGFTVNPAFYKSLPYDPARDFAPVSLMTKRPTLLVVHPSLPAKSVNEYLVYAKANPGKINWATNGAGGVTHLTGAWLHNATHTQVTIVHYKGSASLQLDLNAGRTQVTTTTFLTALPLIKSGKLRALAIASMDRSALLPDLQTIAEQAVPGYDYSSWLGIIAPAGIPPAILAKLSSELSKVAKTAEIAQKLADEGTVMVGSTPEQFRRHIINEINRWQKLVEETGIKLEE